MHRITLLCIGSLKSAWARNACDDYIGRLAHSFDIAIMELPASKEKDSKRQREDESSRLLRACEKHDAEIWILDERGKTMTSLDFAKHIGASRDAGRSLVFLIGGAYGLSDTVRGHGHRILSLSPMTLPHELCRVVFLEQLYRASEITHGSGYHH